MTPVRFLFDQHTKISLLVGLSHLRPAPDALRVGQPGAPPFDTPDPDLLIFCEETRRILVSHDIASMGRHFADHLAAGRRCWGLALAPQSMPFSLLLDELRTIALVSSQEEWLDRIEYLPL